jgi:hypothetical protein
VVIYEMVTGRAPFEGASSGRVLAAHLDEAAPPMRTRVGGVPSPQLAQLVRRCLEKRPDRRFGSMDEVRHALESVPTQPPAAAPSTRSGGGRRRAFSWVGESMLAGALVAVVVAAMVGVASHRARSASALPSVARDVPSGRAVTIEVTASPEDAVVREGNLDLCPSTPCAIVYEGRDADRSATHLLTLARDGYRSRTIRLAAADRALSVELAPVDPLPAREPRAAARPRVLAAPMCPASALLSGYRLDVPY